MKKWKKLGAATILAVSALAVTAQAGTWDNDGTGYTYLFDTNAYARDQIAEIDGLLYGFDANAHMLTGWQQIDNNWYYFDPASGAMQPGWQYIDDAWYYFDPSTGVMQTRWLYVGPSRYYFNDDGVLQQNGFFDAADGYSYYADENGVVLRNTSLTTADGVIYDFDEYGHYRLVNNSSRTAGDNMFSDYVPTNDTYDTFRTNLMSEADEKRHETMDDFYDRYERRDEGSGISNSAKERWENNVRIQLSALFMSDDEIDEFIYEVERGYYTPYYDRADDD